MDTVSINSRLLDAMRREGYAGYDPFDLLNSRLLRRTPLYRSSWFRLAWLQLGKRLPVNLRPVLRVPKMRNPKGVALVIDGLLEDYARTGEGALLGQARELGSWLVEQRSQHEEWADHACWGYHFDWQARAFYVPAGKPNVVTTCYVARALYRLGNITGDLGVQALALDAARFISKALYTEAGGRCFYAYIPGETAFVHNASLWGSAWCAFAGTKLGDDAMVAQALTVARQSLREQASDGSWVYGARGHHQFIDGFHTGYNLEALCMLRDALGTEEFDDSIRSGFEYYRETFFTEDGIAKYYRGNTYPLDMHSFAQAVLTLLKVGGKERDVELCGKVVARAIELMYLPQTGQFIYQRSRWHANRISYARWTQSWAYYSLAFYNRYHAELSHAAN
ncbi:hypothetical protein J2X04_000653 [Lysobacter niabensis]|uniref:Aspartate-semialdehyde dehydrogenase n=1 Tax=Agrilutibacter niabensis TaxID=380628 RepID=A0ABU1VLE8_9GAMM|nr:hypothetical protein [Lysobacter niabensis]MDR7098306.1 hypothetical protein [Lysobacter niabensis]